MNVTVIFNKYGPQKKTYKFHGDSPLKTTKTLYLLNFYTLTKPYDKAASLLYAINLYKKKNLVRIFFQRPHFSSHTVTFLQQTLTNSLFAKQAHKNSKTRRKLPMKALNVPP